MQTARFKHDISDLNRPLEEKIAMLPVQCIRFQFKSHVGTLPYEVEDLSGQQLLYYSNFEVS